MGTAPIDRTSSLRGVRGGVRQVGVLVGACSLLVWSLCALADQNDPALVGLFDELAEAATEQDAARIEAQIWRAWITPPDDDAGLLVARIESAMRTGELDLALTLCDQLVESEPMYAEAWNKRATVRYLVGQHDGSVADIEKTLALEPRHFGAISGLGLIFLKRGDLQGALEAFEAVLTISPASRSARDSVERVRSEIESRDI